MWHSSQTLKPLLSGIPIRSTAIAALVATTNAIGSAFPTSSEAQIIILLAINFTSGNAVCF